MQVCATVKGALICVSLKPGSFGFSTQQSILSRGKNLTMNNVHITTFALMIDVGHLAFKQPYNRKAKNKK